NNQIKKHNQFHDSIKRNDEVEQAKFQLKTSFRRLNQLRDLESILDAISSEIMWVNEKEEQELVFDWGDKNIDVYVPKKEESYSRLMSDLEAKEKEINKLNVKANALLSDNHPASDKLLAYLETLQTQWSWLLKITKCIHVHLKENSAYSQFFKEANETYAKLQKQHETIRTKFSCDKSTPLENLTELLQNLEKEKQRVLENKRQVQSLVSKSKSIVRLKPRNPEVKSTSPVIVKALCDFMQDQKGILQGDEAILKDNSQRSKWLVTGPGGLEMTIPSVCLIIPPPNPISVGLANKNEQYYEAILGIWNQLYINIKSLISWQYCLKDMNYINSLTLTMLSKMNPEEYRTLIKRLETHYQEFVRTSQGSEMFGEEEKKNIQGQFDKTQQHYDTLIIQLPIFSEYTFCFVFKNEFYNFMCLEGLLSALKALLQSLLQAEDIVKVHEARLTEKDTSSLDPIELENYRSSLKHMKNELELKRELLTTMESELSKASHFNSQISDSFHKCDVDLAKYSEQVNLLGDRWRRIQTQIDNRMWDLDKQKDRVTQYQQSKTSLEFWIDNARKRQDTLQTVKINDVQMLMDHINQQKTLYNEIKGKKDKVDEMQKNADNCAASINDYELQLASYSSGLETLLNVPIKKTVLQSPAKVVRQEASGLQAHYIELLTRSSDYYKFLGDLLKNMEELKLRNTRIEMLEEELKRLKDDLLDKNQKNKSLEDALEQYKLELSQSKDELINLEEVKRTTSIQVSAVKESLGSTQGQIQDLNEQLSRVKYQLEEEKRKRRLAEERYNSQQEEYESAVRRRQKEYEEITWVKIDLEKAVKDKEREIERLKLQLEEEATRRRNAESDISKVRTQCTQEISQLKQTYETEIHVTKTTILKASQQKEEDATELRLLVQRLTDEKRDQEEELRRLRQSITLMEVQKTQAEQEVGQQRASVTQETRIRSELELQLRTLKHQREEDEVSLKEAMKSNQDKSRQISLLSFNLEEEGKKRRALELEINHLKQAEAELKSKNVSYLEAINKLKVTEQEIHITRVELEKQTSDKTKAEQSSARLQSHIRELQCSLDGMEAELEKQKNAAQEEFTRRKRMEAELERMTRTCREHTTTITSLKSVQIEASTSGRKYEQDIRALQEALDKSMRDHKATKEDLGAVADELKTLKQKLQQEQVRSHELNQRNETLYKTIEDKSRLLNDYTTEIGKLKTLTQNLTKDRLKLEEELRAARQERDELKSSKDAVDGEKATQISALNVQLQSSSKRTTELQVLISELTKEREMLKTEIEKFQKQTIESNSIQYTELQLERDSLLSKLKLMEQDKNRLQRLEEELARTKLSLETEIRSKQRLQDEKNAMFKEFTTIKTQFEVKETQIRHCESDRDKADRERMSLKSEIERLMRELRTVEERYKSRLLSSEKEASELALKRDTDENVPTIDPSKLLFDGVRRKVTAHQLCDCGIISKATLDDLLKGKKTVDEVLKSYLYGSTCIAGIYDEANDRIMSFYYAMKEGLLMRGTTLELLEAQAASGFIVDPVNNVFLTVEDAAKRGLIGKEFKNKLLSAEKAVTGYKDPSTGKTISLFQAIEKDLIEKGHGIRLLEAQIASGGIIDPLESHRIDVSVAYKRGYFDKEMNEILTYEGDDTKGFFDPNTKENLTYLQLKERCITDSKTGLILLPIKDKNKEKASQESRTNILRKRRVVIVDPDTGLEMSVREAYHKQLIDYETFLDLSEQECEWEEINIKGPDGSSRLVIVDRKTGTQYDIQSCLNKGVIDQNAFDQYRSGKLTLTELADKITSKTSSSEMTIAASNVDDMVTCSSPTQVAPSSPTVRKRFSSISITVSPPGMFDDQSPVAAIFDTETLEKITIPEGHRRGIVDTITAQRLLEAQACTGGIINPATGERLSLEDAVHQSIIDESMAAKLKPAQKAYLGFEDLKTKRRLSAAEAVKETWLPYDAGQRFLEFQYLTGGLVEPGNGRRITMEEAIRKGWIDGQGAQKLQDTRNHQKNLTCPKTKLKISYKEAMDSCMVEEKNGMKMIQASSISSKGISSPYNVSNPGSRSGSRAGSRSGSRRGSVDYSSTFTYSFTSTNFSSNSLC
uniref:Desmoplakin n=1 Tax=Nothobranchius furzeri TaxID=105023 RepID=A0A8C6NMK7_NOTFU